MVIVRPIQLAQLWETFLRMFISTDVEVKWHPRSKNYMIFSIRVRVKEEFHFIQYETTFSKAKKFEKD